MWTQSITLISRDKFALEEELSELREYVTCVDQWLAQVLPKWDSISGDGSE